MGEEEKAAELEELIEFWNAEENHIAHIVWNPRLDYLSQRLPTLGQIPSSARTKKLREINLVRWSRFNPSLIPTDLRVPAFQELKSTLLEEKFEEIIISEDMLAFWHAFRVEYEPIPAAPPIKSIKAEHVKQNALFPFIERLLALIPLAKLKNSINGEGIRDDETNVIVGRMDLCTYIRKLILPTMIIELKNEDTDAIAQGMVYYLELLVRRQPCIVSSVPCLILCMQGSHIAVHGLVFGDETRSGVAVESPLGYLDVSSPYSVQKFAHFWTAIQQCVATITQQTIDTLSAARNWTTAVECNAALYPAHREFFNHHLKLDYIGLEAGITKRVFGARLLESSICRPPCNKLIVKMVTGRYCIEAHQLMSQYGYAPKVFGIEPIANGWNAVVMEAIPKEDCMDSKFYTEQLTAEHKALEVSLLGVFHGLGYVHGDLRDENLLFTTDMKLYMIDFDWCGIHGETCYPPEMNPEIQWHVTAKPNAPILRQHDWHFHRLRYKHLYSEEEILKLFGDINLG